MKYSPFLLLLFTFSCTNSNVQQQLIQTQQELLAAKATIEKLKSQIEPEGDLVHLVFFQLKPDADRNALLAEIQKLDTIEEVLDLEAGPFEDLGDARALSEYGILMQMSFKDKTAYAIYQKHPIHLALRENAGAYLAGPPKTYDFMAK